MDSSRALEQDNTHADAGTSAQKQTKKRVVTPARKEQNRLAQRAYRRRQKEQRRTVQEQPGTASSRPLAPRQDNVGTPDISDSLPIRVVSQVTSRSDGGDRSVTGPRQPVLNPSPPSSISQNEASAVSLAPIAAAPPLEVQTTSSLNMPSGLRGGLEDNFTAVFRACLSNAACIGINIPELIGCENPCMSPFYRASVHMNEDPAALIAASSHGSLPDSLKPTLAQILVPHHASLDLIPIPRLRERAILMCAALPHIFSLWDMKLDIYTRNALTCRGRDTSRGTESHPWDMRSWQAAPWFLSKWKMIIDSDDVVTDLSMPGIPGLWM
ncbi:hypothetical protein F5B22DRAFT_525102 [Xylaria bambusicola]|uniref:uncharacterized protein n=1 Tax=Xylaria bambusicola TaxID=326684 RepID=UPI0020076FB1|nr:uncharacterized protein F5B22DRAFT_525102 [Xylaria bambusicola]KAI0505463.1 hypothetical protein F5B22DRAFT_525102 [Xylaria bambusicola]